MNTSQRTIQAHPENIENTAKLLKQVAEKLYGKNVEILKEQGRLVELLNRVAEVIFAVDSNYKITIFNNIAEAIFGYTEEEAKALFTNDVVKIYHYESSELLTIEEYAFKNKLFTIPKVKIYINREDGKVEERYYTLKSNYIEIEGEKLEAIISLADITREVEIERMKDDFISIASHELKTPVSIVKNNLWMMKNTSGLVFDDRSKRYIGEMEQGLERLRKLVEELLSASRIDQNRMVIDLKEADADTLVAESLDNFIETVKLKNIELISPQKTNCKIMVDLMKFQQVVDNFISNAIKYSNPEKPKIIVETKIDDTFFVFQITDNGPGIGKADYPKIFTKFGRATEGLKLISPGTSTGLGLYISKNFIEAMKGNVGFTSTVGEGSTFWFKIPIHKNKDNTVVTSLS